MTTVSIYISQVARTRDEFISEISSLTYDQSHFKSSPESWSILQIAEHIVWAEQIGVMGMWKAVDGVKNNHPIWEGDPEHHGLHIEEIVAQTWQTKENVPDVAKPRWGGSLAFWISSLKACQQVLEGLGEAIQGMNPEEVIYPHPISGPLNIIQRLQFLSFHMKRHQEQIKRVKAEKGFPQNS